MSPLGQKVHLMLGQEQGIGGRGQSVHIAEVGQGIGGRGQTVHIRPSDCEEPNLLARSIGSAGGSESLSTGHSFFLGIGDHPDSYVVIWVILYGVGGVTCDTPSGFSAHPDNGITDGQGTVFGFYRLGTNIGGPAVLTFSAPTRFDYVVQRHDNADAVGGFGSFTDTSPDIGMGPIAGVDEQHMWISGRGVMLGSSFGAVTTTPDATTDFLIVTSNAYTGFISGFTNHDWPGEASPSHEIGGTTSVTHDYACLSIAFVASACP